MPFTPYHLGPGALFKAVGGHRFSFLIFGGAQVLMDVEPLVHMIRGDIQLHGPSHTLLGALAIGLLCGALGLPAANFCLRIMSMGSVPVTWVIAFTSALIGTFSHIGLDAIMHSDMNPLWPLRAGNALLGLVPVSLLHLACMGSAALAAAIFAVRKFVRSRDQAKLQEVCD